MNNLHAKVSVIVPCYDLGRHLDEAVGSVLAQTCQDFEILIVDDGSRDAETCRLLDDYARPKTRVYRRPHAGVTAARNFGIGEARGDYLCFLDADDRLAPRCLERTSELLDADPGLAFVSFWVRLFGAEAWDWKPERCDLLTLLGDCSVGTATVVRRSAVVAVGGFDPAMELGHEDWDLWLSLTERGFEGTIVPEVLFFYRRHEDSRSAVADRGDTYLRLFADRIRKHDASYRRLLFEALCDKEAAIGRLFRDLDGQERHVSDGLSPQLIERRRELEALRQLEAHRMASGDPGIGYLSDRAVLEREVAAARERIIELEEACRGAQREITELLGSHSWRLTLPARVAYSWLRRLPAAR